ncbi:RluA family pseudouridine synthase [Microcoleus sp. FACHB-1515]|uniref:RluA family pseudouridine synthase n=1 Tax=Cyanophyceae TaxID=3028117 RepID=UPI001689BDFC|nr:RluA family pseudouridine synthase [Microcoleus sp. FACHB-1515]MBD2090716.1 RluA family pseudouridine synthase [Microcoleus sp. FACHB-1515]
MSKLNRGWIYRDRITPTSSGCTVLEFYTQRYSHSIESEWQQRIEDGQILLNDRPTTPATRLKAGQELQYHRPPWVEPPVPPFAIAYEDADLLVVNKPAGLPVLPGGGFVEHTLLGQLRQRDAIDLPTPIHRLGRGTSGLMLLARSPQARAHLSQQMRDRQILKIYRTLVCGGDMPDEFTITQAIGKVAYPPLGDLYAAVDAGLEARSDCRVVHRSQTSLLDVSIATGRPHQIRIHLAAAGYPLVGDPLYAPGGLPYSNQQALPGDGGYHLHAMRLAFIHPHSQEQLELVCDPPVPLAIPRQY